MYQEQKTQSSSATLVLPLDLTTPRDSFYAFLPGITESWLILSSHFVTGLKVVLNLGPFEEGSNDLTTQPSPPYDYLII